MSYKDDQRSNKRVCYRYAQGAPNEYEPNNGIGHKRKWPKVGPNNSCPCASGEKFKKCCRDYKTLVAKITDQEWSARAEAKAAAAIPE